MAIQDSTNQMLGTAAAGITGAAHIVNQGRAADAEYLDKKLKLDEEVANKTLEKTDIDKEANKWSTIVQAQENTDKELYKQVTDLQAQGMQDEALQNDLQANFKALKESKKKLEAIQLTQTQIHNQHARLVGERDILMSHSKSKAAYLDRKENKWKEDNDRVREGLERMRQKENK